MVTNAPRARKEKATRQTGNATIHITGNIEGPGEIKAEEEPDKKHLLMPVPAREELRLFIHPTAEISPLSRVGDGSRIWNETQVRERAKLGKQCVVGKGVYIGQDVTIGDYVKIQSGAVLCQGVMIESGVFIGAHVCFNNDRYPRSITMEGRPKTAADREVECTLVRYGASIGAGSIILPGVRIGTYAVVSPGSVVTKDVPAHYQVAGNPAQMEGYACRCGRPLQLDRTSTRWYCGHCRESYTLK